MLVVLLLFVALLAAAVLYVLRVYSGLVALRGNVRNAWGTVDLLVSQRHDELARLVETCRRHMRHDQPTLDRVMQARSAVCKAQETADVRALGAAEGQLRHALGQLFALAGNHPPLMADPGYLRLQTRISALDEAIAERREFYNETVSLNNIRLRAVPDLIVARLFGLNPATLFEFTDQPKRDFDPGRLSD
jgi:LemA protein